MIVGGGGGDFFVGTVVGNADFAVCGRGANAVPAIDFAQSSNGHTGLFGGINRWQCGQRNINSLNKLQ